MSKVIAVNAGSSSLKFKLYEMPQEKVICSGLLERIGLDMGRFVFKKDGQTISKDVVLKDHEIAVKYLVESLIEHKCVESLNEIKGIGHRIVQGGHYFNDSVVFDDRAEELIESLIPLAPLHNKAHLIGFRAFKRILPEVKSVAVFDTAYHQTMLPEDYMYACKYEYYEKYMVRKYGAHGTSHKYLAQEGTKYTNGNKVITCHIGSGASLCANLDQKCVTTSMGLTPLAGIMMGTRTGDIDASVMNYLVTQTGKSCEEIYQEFNKQSGLLGICGYSDTRDVEAGVEKGDEKAVLAYKMYSRRIADYIGQYFVRLGGCDLIIFSAGVGENSSTMRKFVCENLKDALGVVLDDTLNEKAVHGEGGVISSEESKIKVVVIPTDEEVMIARDIVRLLDC